jgi:hypothetical protein
MIEITTNNVPRLLVDGYQLTSAERAGFGTIDWSAVERGEDSVTFFRYGGTLYDLGEFERVANTPWGDTVSELAGWDGYSSDTYFSGVVVRFVPDDRDRIVVGRFFVTLEG